MRDSFVFYRSFADGIKCLNESDQLEALWDIIDYALDGTLPDGEGLPQAIFNMAKPQIDTNNKRYENGLKGGRPKTKDKPKQNQKETKTKPKVTNEKTKGKPNDNVNVNDNENENDNVNVNDKEELKEENPDTHIPLNVTMYSAKGQDSS